METTMTMKETTIMRKKMTKKIILVPLQNLLRHLLPHNRSLLHSHSSLHHSRRSNHHLLQERWYLHPLPRSLLLPHPLPQDHLTLQDFPPLDHFFLPPHGFPPHCPPPHNRSNRRPRRNNRIHIHIHPLPQRQLHLPLRSHQGASLMKPRRRWPEEAKTQEI